MYPGPSPHLWAGPYPSSLVNYSLRSKVQFVLTYLDSTWFLTYTDSLYLSIQQIYVIPKNKIYVLSKAKTTNNLGRWE